MKTTLEIVMGKKYKDIRNGSTYWLVVYDERKKHVTCRATKQGRTVIIDRLIFESCFKLLST